MMIDSLRKARLIWHCRRGMLELDLILIPFAENFLESMTESQIVAFDELLSCIDPELFDWLMGYSSPTDRKFAEIVEFIKTRDTLR